MANEETGSRRQGGTGNLSYFTHFWQQVTERRSVVLANFYQVQQRRDTMMPGKLMDTRRYAFILRIWLEPDPTPGARYPILRGSLQASDGEEILYFSSLDNLPAILRELLEHSGQV